MSDFLKALDCLPHKKIPLWELEFHLWNTFSSKTFYCGADFQRLTNAGKERALHINSEIIFEVSSILGFSAVNVPGGYWELAPGKPAYYWLPENYKFQQVEILKKNCPKEITLVANTGGVLGIPDSANYVEFSMKLLIDPKGIDQLAKVAFKNGLENVKKFTDLGIDVMLTASDLAHNSGPYFSPDQMKRFILPYLGNWATKVKEAGAKSILHTDGNINLYLDMLEESGINAIQALDPVAGINMIDTLEKVNNKVCLCGNVDCGLLLIGTPDEVYGKTKSLLEKTKTFNGFVLGSSNAVVKEVPKENYLAMIKALNDAEKK